MTLPIQANTTCDVYHPPNLPPGSSPDVSALACHLRPAFGEGRLSGRDDDYTHVLSVAADADVRDGNATTTTATYGVTASSDVVCIPDRNGTQFLVYFVERVGRGTAQDHKRVYLARSTLAWPTDEL